MSFSYITGNGERLTFKYYFSAAFKGFLYFSCYHLLCRSLDECKVSKLIYSVQCMHVSLCEELTVGNIMVRF